MATNGQIGRWCLLQAMLLVGLLLPAGPAFASEPEIRSITVDLASGRRFAATVDGRTDASQLWLRWGAASHALLRPIDWQCVTQVQVGRTTLGGEEYRERITAPGVLDDNRIEAVETGWPPPPIRPKYSSANHGKNPRKAGPARTLAIDAWVANWDADVEVDGLIIQIEPRDAAGRLVPLFGTLQIDLTGARTSSIDRRQPYRRMGHWTEAVEPDDFGPGGATYRLPFQAVHPEHDIEVFPHGAVHVRLLAPGQGTFEATESSVRIRPYSSVRDHLQQATGRRFFPQEMTGRHGR